MSDLITTAQDTFRDNCIEAYVAVEGFVKDMVERIRDNRGQTAAEYMGVLLLVAAIISAVVLSPIGEDIRKAISAQITNISTGKKPVTGDGQ